MPDPIESRMNFIVEQQAQFAVAIQKLEERQEATQRLVDANTDRIRQLVDVTMSLAHHLEETDRRLGVRIEQLAEAQAHTDHRLDALIDVVDKLVRRNGPRRRA